MHLHHGDEGLMNFFRKFYASLSAGGILVLEYQMWIKYAKSAKLTNTNVDDLKLRPENFPKILTEEIGFSKYTELGVSQNAFKGIFIITSFRLPTANMRFLQIKYYYGSLVIFV